MGVGASEVDPAELEAVVDAFLAEPLVVRLETMLGVTKKLAPKVVMPSVGSAAGVSPSASVAYLQPVLMRS